LVLLGPVTGRVTFYEYINFEHLISLYTHEQRQRAVSQAKLSMIEKFAPAGKDLQLAEIGLNQQMLPVFLGILLAATIAWLFLSRRLYDVLKHNYPRLYEALGSPKLIMKKSLTTNCRVIMFLFRRTYESTDDVDVIRLCRGLRYIFLIYLICFMGSLMLIIDKIS